MYAAHKTEVIFIQCGMESYLLLFVLFFISEDPTLKERLSSFLAFYRENRDLIAAFTQNGGTMPESKPSEQAEKEESRPQKEVGPRTILEEYLARLG